MISRNKMCLWGLSTAALLAGCSAPMEDEDLAGDPDAASVEQELGNPGDVGVIPEGTTCPTNFHLARAYMDCEDSNGLTQQGGWHGAWNVTSRTGGVDMKVCRVPGSLFRPLTSDPTDTSRFYAVLQMGENCPPDSVPFTRRVDNEDSSNGNSVTSDIEPSTVTRSPSNSNLKFCLFRNGATTSSSFPNLGFAYGVFAGNHPNRLNSGFVLTDDEDSDNNNATIAGSENIRLQAEQIILSGGRIASSTRFQMVKAR